MGADWQWDRAERYMAENKKLQKQLELANSIIDNLQKDNNSVHNQLAIVVETMEKIDNWTRAYPLDVFPKPDLKKARKLLEDGGMTLDAISAYAMRHVITQVGKYATDALVEIQRTGEEKR